MANCISDPSVLQTTFNECNIKNDIYNNLVTVCDDIGDLENEREFYVTTVDPTINSDSANGFAIGDEWMNTKKKRSWICIDDSVGAAVWAFSSGRVGCHIRSSFPQFVTVPSGLGFPIDIGDKIYDTDQMNNRSHPTNSEFIFFPFDGFYSVHASMRLEGSLGGARTWGVFHNVLAFIIRDGELGYTNENVMTVEGTIEGEAGRAVRTQIFQGSGSDLVLTDFDFSVVMTAGYIR